MTSAATILLEYVCPILGIFTALVMFAAPYSDVEKAVARGSLGDLNPLPWAFMLGNTIGWVTYSFLIHNLFVFFANAPGILLAAWFNLAASKLLFKQQYAAMIPAQETGASSKNPQEPTPRIEKAEEQDTLAKNGSEADLAARASTAVAPTTIYQAPNHDYWTVGIVAFWLGIIAIVGFGRNLAPETRQLTVGIVVNLNLVFFYGAPLSTIFQVLRTGNTASIHVWTMLTNTANGVFWTAYGFAVLDFYIFVPNGLGALLGFVQISLCMLYPREAKSGETSPEVAKEGDEEAAGKAHASSKTALATEASESPLTVPFPSTLPTSSA